MEEQIERSCWGIMTWTVLALGGVLALVYLLGGFEPTIIASR